MPLQQHVVFLATSTEEKIRDLNIAAEKKRWPITFFNLEELGDEVHNVTEDGADASANATRKLENVQDKIDRWRKDWPAIDQFCRKHSIAEINDNCVWFATEDSGITMPQEIWDNIPDSVMDVLPDDVKERLRKSRKGPEVDTAPFLSATLGNANINHIIEKGLKNFAEKNNGMVSLSQMRFVEECVIKFEPYKKTNGNGVLKAEGKVENAYANSPYLSGDDVMYNLSNYTLMAPRNRNKKLKTAYEHGVNYIAHHSARAAALEDMVTQINYIVGANYQLLKAKGEQVYDLWTDIAYKSKKEDLKAFNVGIINADTNHPALTEALKEQGEHLHSAIMAGSEAPTAGASTVEKATFHLSYPERVLSHSDGLILMPDSANVDGRPMSLDEKLYMLSSIVVAKQLIARDKKKPVVIINTDNSWNNAIRIHTALANCQMTKDHALPLSPIIENAGTSSNAYFTVVNGEKTTDENAMKAAALLIKDASLSYHRVEDKEPIISKMGLSPFDENRKEKSPRDLVAIFCSASSENAPLNHFVCDISEKLAKKGKGIICGGGDRYTMGAILDGVKKFRLDLGGKISKAEKQTRGYIAGISTHSITTKETQKGAMPDDYSYRELTANIYERMAKMMVPAETIVVAPGGAGTLQEWMGFNLLKKKMPKLFAEKKLVIFDPDLMTDPNNLLLGNETTTESNSLQTHVFDKVLGVVFSGNTIQHRLHDNFNKTGTYVFSAVDDVIQACTGPAQQQAVLR